MILNRECDYSLRVFRSLANGDKKTVEEICQDESIPEPFAYKLLKKLEKSGFLKSFRGRGGGYQLKKELHTFTILDVIRTINPNLYFFECLRKEDECPNKTGKNPCKIHDFLKETQNVLTNQITSLTLHDILQQEGAV